MILKDSLPRGDEPLSTQSSQATIAQFERYVIPNYRRYPVSLVRGEGSWIWDAEGKRYLDFFPGWGCNLLGHCPPRVVEAVREQVGQLIHVPNTWYMESQGALAEALSQRSFGGQSFFCNSGAEANEAAIKLARAHGHEQGRFKIVTMEGGFHGRTSPRSRPRPSPSTTPASSRWYPASSMCLTTIWTPSPRSWTSRRPRSWSSPSRARGGSIFPRRTTSPDCENCATNAEYS